MPTSTSFARIVGSALFIAAFAPALPVHAAAYAEQAALPVTGTTLVAMPGSAYDALTVTDAGFTVTVPAGEAFIVRSSGGAPRSLQNDIFLDPCHVLSSWENQLLINGPITANVTVGSTNCSTANVSTDQTTMIKLATPNGAETVHSGDKVLVSWTVSGKAFATVRIALSTDDGQTYPVAVAGDEAQNGMYEWTVPSMQTAARARMRIQAINQGSIVAMDVTDAAFTIIGDQQAVVVPPPVTPPAAGTPVVHPAYDPTAETKAAVTIDADRGFVAPAVMPKGIACVAGLRIKGASSAAVYYCGKDGKRHAFPNQRVHDSWFSGFGGVVTVSDADLAAVPLGANVTYRPGVRMIKITTDPKVYAVAADGALRWIPDEWTARKLYGTEWNKKVDDLSDAFFGNDYHIGEQVPSL